MIFLFKVSQGKLKQTNLLGHLECFGVLVSCTSVCVYANMHKQTGICLKYLRAEIYLPARFDIGRVVVSVFNSDTRQVSLLGINLHLVQELKQQSQTVRKLASRVGPLERLKCHVVI